MSEERLLPCPFCGGECDPAGWLGGDNRRGPECESCGATADSVADWNRRSPPAQHVAVPVEPTFEQWQAGSLALKGHNDTPFMDSPTRKAVAIAVYKAMLAAAKDQP